MRTLRYVVADVFTETPLTGNPVAVFTDARELGAGLPGAEQRAREDGVGPDAFRGESFAQLACGAAAVRGERPQLVRLSVRGLGMANEVELHGS